MVARSIALFICVLLGTLSFLLLAKADRPAETDKQTEAVPAGGIKIAGETGMASIYAYQGDKTAGGSKAANGEKIRATDMSAAHKSIPFGTMVRVTNLVNGLSAVVRINDRGPFVGGRIIDLTPAAARALGFSAEKEGLAPVTLTVLKD
jgi:rare lipoprotein A